MDLRRWVPGPSSGLEVRVQHMAARGKVRLVTFVMLTIILTASRRVRVG